MLFTDLEIEKILYINLDFKTEDDVLHKSKVFLNKITSNSLIFLLHNDKNYVISPESEIIAYFVIPNIAYMSPVKILNLKYGENRIEIETEIPTELEHKQNRQHYRIDMFFQTKLEVVDTNNKKYVFKSKAVNFSAGGIKIANIIPTKDKNDILIFNDTSKLTSYKLDMNIKPNKIVSLEADIVRVEKQKTGIELAFCFKNVDRKTTDELCTFVFQHQLKMSKLNG